LWLVEVVGVAMIVVAEAEQVDLEQEPLYPLLAERPIP
jgi:hypothetical protein